MDFLIKNLALTLCLSIAKTWFFLLWYMLELHYDWLFCFFHLIPEEKKTFGCCGNRPRVSKLQADTLFGKLHQGLSELKTGNNSHLRRPSPECRWRQVRVFRRWWWGRLCRSWPTAGSRCCSGRRTRKSCRCWTWTPSLGWVIYWALPESKLLLKLFI